jgi:hypothetical protein
MDITKADFVATDPAIFAQLYTQLALIHRICREHNIKYWLVGGSLLGQFRGEYLQREKGIGSGPEIIPHDDDIDIGIDVNDADQLRVVLEPEAKKIGCVVWNSEHGMKLKANESLNNSSLVEWPRAGTDIFFYKKVPDYNHPSTKEVQRVNGYREFWILAKEISLRSWPRDYFLVEEINNLTEVKFGPITAMISNNPIRYLQTVYGKNCITHQAHDFDHVNNKKHALAGIELLIE